MWRDIDPRAPERDRPEPGRGRVGGLQRSGVRTGLGRPARRVHARPRPATRFVERACPRKGQGVPIVWRRRSGACNSRRVPRRARGRPARAESEDADPPGARPRAPSRSWPRADDSVRRWAHPNDAGDAHGPWADVLEQSATARRQAATRQAFYVGISKPRELAHDSRVYSAYMKAAERLAERGEPIRRVVLEEELKREYQRFLQAENRARRERGETPEERSDAVARWAQEHQLPYDDGHVQFPDARLEYEDRDGRRSVEDIEVVTPHYRGAHAAAKVRAGFTRYRAVGARLGGLRTTGRSGRGVNPRLAEELLQ